jgi:restriction endonuclease S subunit
MGVTLRGRDATRAASDGACQLIRIGDISQDGTWVDDQFVSINPRESLREDQFLRPGDVLFPNRGTRTTAIAYLLDLPRAFAGAQFFVLRPNTSLVLPEYLAWFLRTEEAARHFAERRKGTYVQIVERKDLAELEIPLPPLLAQQHIVEVARLAVQERTLTERLAHLKWKLMNGKLAKTAGSTAQPTSGSLVHEED